LATEAATHTHGKNPTESKNYIHVYLVINTHICDSKESFKLSAHEYYIMAFKSTWFYNLKF